jgi:hypothetical protein
LDELRRHWDEYGIGEEEVHPDYVFFSIIFD